MKVRGRERWMAGETEEREEREKGREGDAYIDKEGER